jgi:hypothetical protein
MSPRRQQLDDEVIGGAEVPHDIEWAQERGEQKEAISNLKADVAGLRTELASAREDITEIKLMLATNKGGVKMLLAVGGIAAALGGGMASLIAEWLRWMHGQQ